MFLCRHFENPFHIQFCNLQVFFAVNQVNDLAACTAYNRLHHDRSTAPVTSDKLNSFSQTFAASNCYRITNVCNITTCAPAMLSAAGFVLLQRVCVCVCLSVQKLRNADQKLMKLRLT